MAAHVPFSKGLETLAPKRTSACDTLGNTTRGEKVRESGGLQKTASSERREGSRRACVLESGDGQIHQRWQQQASFALQSLARKLLGGFPSASFQQHTSKQRGERS